MKKIGCIAFVSIVLLAALFIFWKYMYVYSTGYREGLLNKFSTKGMAYKTNEGEMLMPGFIQSGNNQLGGNNFYFSALDSNVVNTLLQATGKKVKVHYKQYNASLPWRGNDYAEKGQTGQYIVNEAIVVQ